MKDVNHAIAVLRDLTELPELELSADGHLAMIFDGAIPVNVVSIDERCLELSTPLVIDDLDAPERLTALLAANYHGAGTGFARVAIDERDGSALLCERIDLVPLTSSDFESRIESFVKYATFWRSGEASALLPIRRASEPLPASDDGVLVIRS